MPEIANTIDHPGQSLRVLVSNFKNVPCPPTVVYVQLISLISTLFF